MGDGFTWTSHDLDESAEKARHAWEAAKTTIAAGEHDLIILDEFTYPLKYGWIDVDETIGWLREHKPPMLHLIITGRYAPDALTEFADVVTDMTKVKHAFDAGIRAQPGLEF